MIDLQTDLDYLYMLAADSDSADIRAAAVDLKNLTEYAARLERDIWAADGADDIVNSLDRRIDRAISRRLETENNRDETSDETLRELIRETMRSMFSDGDVMVSVESCDVDLELSLDV